MSGPTSHEHEVRRILIAANGGDATDEQLARLDELIGTDPRLAGYAARMVDQQSSLAWRGIMHEFPGTYAAPAGEPSAAMPSREGALKSPVRRTKTKRPRWRLPARQSLPSGLSAAVMALAVVAAYWLGSRQSVRDVAISAPADVVHAQLIGSTQCIWDSEGSVQPAIHRPLEEGESLQLLEGIAEVQLTLGAMEARLQLEGPAALVLMRRGIPSLRYGKITVETEGSQQSVLPIETSFGRVLLRPGAAVGISAFGSTAEVHVFGGMVIVESPWLHSPEEELTGEMVAGGEALFLDHVGGSELRVSRGVARASGFTPQISMEADFLLVGSDYVEAIRQAAPVAYWRFEADADGQIVNEMADRFHGRIQGPGQLVGPEGNRALAVGMGAEHGFMLVDDDWDRVLEGDFSLEAWIKASHYHRGSFVGFTGEFSWERRWSGYGVLLEVCGTSMPGSRHQPERVRFLHRSTLGDVGGVNCFSDRPYVPRRWQHVVGVREANGLALYLDGQLVKAAEDETSTPEGLRLVIGQLYPEKAERFFIGHIDEVAIYDRALSAAEIRRHYELLRPRPKTPGSS